MCVRLKCFPGDCALLQTQHVNVFCLVTWSCRRTGLELARRYVQQHNSASNTLATRTVVHSHLCVKERGVKMQMFDRPTCAWAALWVVGVTECGHAEKEIRKWNIFGVLVISLRLCLN